VPSEDAIELSLPARAEHVAMVRHVVAALGEAVGLSAATVDDVKLAVTEACTNVVRHAYRGGEGRLEVSLDASGGRLVVVVTDHGVGIDARPAQGPGAGLGLPLMSSLAQEFEIRPSQGSGSEVRMSFEAGDDTLEPA
jgi:serine/threonine-protein kinase RsbW